MWGSLPVSAETAEPVSVSAYAAVLYEPVSGTVLFEKNSREVLPVASTTKIMTALLAFESEHRGDPVTITPEMISVEGSSMGLRAGEVLALGDIARGMMMASGNDGANAIALYLSDSTEAFSEKINARAAELHMMQTHFVTPSGLDAEGHGSTAYDMALLAAEAMQNEEFAAAVGQTTLSVPFISPEKTVRYENHNRLLKLYPDCTGIKTGFTKKAGRCLVSSAERDGARLICVTLNAPDDWNDHMNLYDYGFAQLAERTYTAGFQLISLPVVGGEKECISLTLQTQESAVLPKDVTVTAGCILPQFVYAPVEKRRRNRLRAIQRERQGSKGNTACFKRSLCFAKGRTHMASKVVRPLFEKHKLYKLRDTEKGFELWLKIQDCKRCLRSAASLRAARQRR